MTRTTAVWPALLLAGVLSPACSGGAPPATDGGGGVDADAWRGEGPAPDRYTGRCDPACLDQDISLCAKLPGEDRCVDCLSDADCTGNPGALGNTCDLDRHYCICGSDAEKVPPDSECAGNKRGSHCQLEDQICVCNNDKDCQPPLPVCVDDGAKTCRAACKADTQCDAATPRCDVATGRCLACLTEADCAKNGDNPHCDVPTGRCVGCTADSQCPAAASPFCDHGSCVECKQPANCAQSPEGGFCDHGRCGCAGGQDCQSAAALGVLCLTQLAYPRCGCTDGADCAGKAPGPVCHPAYHFCGCSSDADCSVAPDTTCIFPAEGADYRRCQPPCSGDPECQQRMLAGVNAGLKRCSAGHCVACTVDGDCAGDLAHPRCQPGTGRCVRCLQNAECGGLSPICDAASGDCIECGAETDCASHPNGPVCQAGLCGCTDDAGCAGPAVWGKSCVASSPGKRCGCTAEAGCAGKAPGPHCAAAGKCSCLGDGDCSTTPGTVCALPYAGAGYQYCQKPCASTADCVFHTGLGRCSPGGKCVACLGDTDCPAGTPFCNVGLGTCAGCRNAADCAGQPWDQMCDLASGCVECLADGDCTTSSLGPTCSKGACVCVNAVDCAGNLNGRLCDPGVHACSCVSAGRPVAAVRHDAVALGVERDGDGVARSG